MSEVVKADNPFYSNYIFSKSDLGRCKIRLKDKIKLIFKPMFVQVNEGYAWYFKIGNNGAYYIFKCEDLTNNNR